MTCEEVQKLLPEYCENRLESKVRSEVEQHLSLCPGCQQELTTERSLNQWLKSRQTKAVSPEFTQTLLSQIGYVTAKPPRWFENLLGLSNYWAPALAAVLVVIFAGKTLLDWIGRIKSLSHQAIGAIDNIPSTLETSSLLNRLLPDTIASNHSLPSLSLGTLVMLLVLIGGLVYGIKRIFRS
jgi:predicted anti-sigma-YlaC factor YlaD